MWFERLKNLFAKSGMPEDTQTLFKKAESSSQILAGLDDLVTRNELALRDIEKELRNLEDLESREVAAIRSGEVEGRSRRTSLRKIQRLRRQMDALEDRMKIHDANIELHMKLMAKVQAVQAMEMQGVEEEQIETILVDFESQLDGYTGTLRAGDLADSQNVSIDPDADRELADLEAEILGEQPSGTPAREAPTPEPAADSDRGSGHGKTPRTGQSERRPDREPDAEPSDS